MAVLLLLKVKNKFLALVRHDSDGLVLEQVTVDVDDFDGGQWNHDRMDLVRRVHDRKHLQTKWLPEAVAVVLFQKHETGVLALDGDPFDDLLDLVQVRRQLVPTLLG